MSYKNKIMHHEGHVWLQVTDEASDGLVRSVLQNYLVLLEESNRSEAQKYIVNGAMAAHQLENVHQNLTYIAGITAVLSFLGDSHVE